MKFDFIGCLSINQTGHSCEILTFLAVILLFSSYFFVSIAFGDGFFQFQDKKVSLKQAPRHNRENTIFQSRDSGSSMLP